IATFLLSAPPPPDTYTLSLHDALPISDAAERPVRRALQGRARQALRGGHARAVREGVSRTARQTVLQAVAREYAQEFGAVPPARSEEHTSELQSRFDLVCRLLLEKKKK